MIALGNALRRYCELRLYGGMSQSDPQQRETPVFSGDSRMISLLPEDVVRSAIQLACYGFAAFTAAVAFVLTPRW
jgi:hypothetical protein